MAQPPQPQYGMGGDLEGNQVVTASPSYVPPPTMQSMGPADPRAVITWMDKPSTVIGCPPGLEYLSQLDQILVHQQVELLEVVTDWQVENKYQVKNTLGQQIFFAYEESDACMRQCCEEDRGFQMHIVDNSQQEVMRVVREFKCCAGCDWCADCIKGCAFTLTVEAPPGRPIGYIRQRQSFCKPLLDVLDENHHRLLRIRGPYCPCQTCCCTEDVDFKVMTADDTEEIGKISKQWAGIAKELYTNADNFGIRFPMNLDVKAKALLLGALFLIDFMFFEDGNNSKD